MVDEFRSLGAPDLVLTREAVDVGTGAPDPPSFDDGGSMPRSGHVPGQELSTRSASQDENLVSFSRHGHLLVDHRAKKSRIAAAISLAWVSSAKCPVPKNWTIAPGMSRLTASAPRGRKKGSFLPHTASKRGLCVRK